MRLSLAKLPRSKWTACAPQNKEKHFMVLALVAPATPDGAVELVTMEAIHSGRQSEIAWRALYDSALWRQGWQ